MVEELPTLHQEIEAVHQQQDEMLQTQATRRRRAQRIHQGALSQWWQDHGSLPQRGDPPSPPEGEELPCSYPSNLFLSASLNSD